MSERIRVYIAGPYSRPDPELNTLYMLRIAQQLVEKGFCPFVPLLTHFWHFLHPNPYEIWMEMDLIWVGQCEVLLRLEGESPGADREVAHAGKLGIPVVHSVEELMRWRTKRQQELVTRVS